MHQIDGLARALTDVINALRVIPLYEVNADLRASYLRRYEEYCKEMGEILK
jgi:hypothetical protein